MDLHTVTGYGRMAEASENFDLKELKAIHNEAVADEKLRQKTVLSHTIANIISHNLIEILQQATSTSSTIRTEIEDTAQQILEQMKSPKDTEEYDLPGHDLFDKKTEADNLRVLMQKSLGKTIENFLRQDLQQKVAAIQESLKRIEDDMSCVPFEDFLDTLIPHDYTDHGITQKHLLQEPLSASTPQYVRIWMDRLTEGEIQMGKELYGTLCVDCLLLVDKVFTVLDDGENRGVVLSIDITRSPDFAYNYSTQSQQHKFPCGLKLAIRNPHLVRTKNGCLCIWIDNLGFLVPVPSIPRAPAAADLLMEGIRGSEIGDMDTAIHLFTRALNSLRNTSDNDSEIMKDLFELHFRRANAYIKKIRYTNALADALFLQRNGDARHQILIAQLLEVTGNYEEAYLLWKLLFDKGHLDLDRHRPDMERCRDLYILKLRQRFKRYLSMPEMVAGSSFVGPIEIRVSDESSKSERGLFITQDCMAGELILVCDPVVDTMKEDEIHLGLHRLDAPTDEEAQELCHKLVVEVNRSEVLRKRIRTLFSAGSSAPDIHLYWPEKYEEKRSETDLREEIEGWPGDELVLQYCVRLYATGVQYPDKNEPSEAKIFCGLYLLPGFINHSCIPTASRFYVGKSMFVIAARDMKAGEEITLSYVCAIHSVWEREGMLSEWGIDDCHCNRCKFEHGISDLQDACRTNMYETSQKIASLSSLEDFYERSRRLVKRFEILLESMRYITPMEREWLVASHQHSLLSGTNPKLYKSTGELKSYCKEATADYIQDDNIRGRLQVLQAIQATVPGHPYIVQMLVREAELIYAINDELGSLELIDSTLNMARNATSTVYGYQENVNEVFRGISICNRTIRIKIIEGFGLGASHQNAEQHQPDFPSHKDMQIESSSNQARKGNKKGKSKKKQSKKKQKKH